MKWLNNVKIRTKLMMAFITIAFIAGIVGFIGITKISKTNENYTELYSNYGIAISDIADVSISYQRMRINLENIILEKGSNDRNKYVNKIRTYDNNIQASLVKFEKSIQTEEGKKELTNIKLLLEKYNQIKEDIITLSLSNKEVEGLALLREEVTQNTADELNNSIDNLFQLKISGGIEKSNEYSSEVHYAIITMIILIVIAVIIAMVLGVLNSNLIGNPISKLIDVTNEISNGNLDVKIINESKDEMGIFSESMRNMANKLNRVLEHIGFAAEQVTVGSKQVADSTIALSHGATEQASAVEELTASIEEISSQIKINAENAKKANNIAGDTKINAAKRNDEMQLMLKAMDEINVCSKNISKIIKVIDEIAFQTNILALNAAVEAARAGQYGKGFAVVAEEVRNLAARSANAAKETTEIIEASISKIGDGTKIANQTAYALNTIVVDIGEVASIISEISEASEEQATGISQISQGIMQISEVVQSNSATAEESAAASEELAGQAEVLKEQVQMFNLKNDYSNFNIRSKDLIPNGNIKNNKKRSEPDHMKNNKNKSNNKGITLSDSEFGKY